MPPRLHCFTEEELYDLCEKNPNILKYIYDYTDNALNDIDIINARVNLNKFIENNKYKFHPRTEEQRRLQNIDRFEDIIGDYLQDIEMHPENSPSKTLKGFDLERAKKLAERSKILLSNLKLRKSISPPLASSPPLDSIANFIDSLPPIISPIGSPLPPIRRPVPVRNQKIDLL
jgi:hypothetical protein